jgi:transposase
MNVRYRVTLSQAERDHLVALLSGGKHAARKLKRAQILLAADAGATDEAISATVAASGSTIYRTKRRFGEIGLDAALSEEPRPGGRRKLSAKDEALLVATACSKPPAGRAADGFSLARRTASRGWLPSTNGRASPRSCRHRRP